MGIDRFEHKDVTAAMKSNLYAVGNGIKSIPLDQLTSWAELGNMPWASSRPGEKSAAELSSTVAFLYRAIELRASSLTAVPWSIYRAKGEQTVWSSEDPMPPPELAGFADLQEIIYRTEGALSVVSTAYLARLRNRIRTTGIQWLDPYTMTPYWTPEGLTHFNRASTFETRIMSPEDVIYIWQKGTSEIYPKRSPAYAALAAANVLYALDTFVASFFARGAIKATLLTVKEQPDKTEAERLKSWWQRTVSGVRNAFATEVIVSEVQPVIVGEGIGELSNTSLTQEKREDIATAMGVPYSLLMSNASNFATAEADRKNFYEQTVLPQANLIERQLNAQLWMPMGLRMTFAPQKMSIFQEDENRKAEAFGTYVASGVLPSIAAELLGIELPEGFEYSDLDPEAKPEPAPIIVQPVPPALPAPQDAEDEDEDDAEQMAERKRFVRWAKNRAAPMPEDFQSDLLSDEEKEALLSEAGVVPFVLPGTFTPESVRALLLQLDPDDDEKEQKVRMALERTHARKVGDAMADQYADVAKTKGNAQTAVNSLRLKIRVNDKVKAQLDTMLRESADLGVSTAVNQLDGVGYGFDALQAQTSARTAASQQVGALVQGIDEVNRKALEEAVSRWMDSGRPLSSLVDELAPLFGRSRAETIAATEVTNAYSRANRIAWTESGVVKEREWVTVQDERVCPRCGPMHGQRAPLNGTYPGGEDSPALHPRCRCFERPVLED